MRYIIPALLLLAACSPEPSQNATAEPPTSEDMSAMLDANTGESDMNSMPDSDVIMPDMSTGPGQGVSKPPGWVLRDKDGVVVDAILEPTTPTSFSGDTGGFDTAQHPCVSLQHFNGQTFRALPVELATGTVGPCTTEPYAVYHLKDDCSDAPAWFTSGYHTLINGELLSTWGSPVAVRPETYYTRPLQGGGCSATQNLSNFNFWEFKAMPIDALNNITSRAPFSLSVE